MKKLSVFFFLFLMLLGINSCKKGANLIKFKDGFTAYIHAYTTGVVSRSSPIRIRFTQALIDIEKIGNAVESNVLSFEPSIKGKAIWEDDRTIRFDAEEWLPSTESYVGRVNVAKLYNNVPKDLKTFMFDFKTKDQFLEVSIEGLRSVSETDLRKQRIIGTVYTADVAENDKVEQVLTATQAKNSDLKITWEHDADQMFHHFVIENVDRKDQPTKVELNWNGRPIGVSQKGKETYEVPALGDFKVVDVAIQQEPEQVIIMTFSDPLQRNQDLEGRIQIRGITSPLNFVIESNTIRAYPTARIAGERTINVARGILNVMNKPMPNPSEWTVEFAEIPPQVALIGRGVILPNTNKGLIFPFKAVSLNAVDVEIFKIYENNILQFLQVNDLDGEDELERVGKVVFQKKVSLQQLNPKADFRDWTRYALDLNNFLKREPNAIYQVRISFQQDYSTYFCSALSSESSGNLQELVATSDDEESDEIKSYWDWNYYNDYYDWEHHKDPCHEAYYKSYDRFEHFASANVIASDLGLITKRGEDGSYFVAVNNLTTTQPLSGVQVKFYNYQQQVIKQVQTDGDGVAMVAIKEKPYFVVAEKGSQRGYLKLRDGYALSLSRYDVDGERPYKGLKGFIYGERGVWRPGDSLYLNFVLEDKYGTLPASHPVTFELYDVRGQLMQKMTKADHVNHIYDFSTVTSPDAPTGNWQARVKVGGAVFEKTIKIETVKPNRLKIDLDFGKQELVADESLEGRLQVNWLHGAPANNLKTEAKVQLYSTETTFKNFGDFVFDDPARRYSGTPQTIFDGTTNSDGKAQVPTKISTNDAAPGRMKANFSIRAYEKSGDFSTDNFSLPYDPYEGYVGIKLPVKRSGEKRLDMNKNYQVNFVAVSRNGNVAPKRKLNVGLYRVEWRWWWDSSSDDVTNYSSSAHYGAIQKENIVTNEKGQASWNVKVDDWGRYMVRICDTETGHCTGDIFYAGWPWDEDNDAAKEAAAMLVFSSDKNVYNVGETVQLKVPLSESGRALITIENGSKVLESYWKTAKKGDNVFSFTATKEMAPNVYAHVTLVQPHAQVQNDLPIRLYGVVPIQIEDPRTRLEPQIQMAKTLQPDAPFEVKVKEASGKPMAYTIAVVDDGLLNLTRFKTPNPWNYFYAKEAIGVKTWDMYDYVMGAYSGKLERILSIGGDDALGPREGQKANRFKPVVMHLGPFYLKAGQTKAHRLQMPNYVGSVRTMVVAANDGAYGSAENTTPVKSPLMVLGTLPRVLSPSESVKLPVAVFAMEDKIRKVSVKIETNDLLSVQGGSVKSVSFDKQGDKVVEFDLKVLEKTGVGKVKIIATSADEIAEHTIELDVRNPNPYVVDVTEHSLEKGETWSQNFNLAGMAGTNAGILEISNIPPINLGERLNYLLQYPHGCIEQTTSSAFPQLYVNQLLKMDKKQAAQVDKNIQATIDRLRLFQVSNGGFAYWPGEGEADSWGSTYAGHFLLEASKRGFSLPPSMLERWTKYQRSVAKTWSGNDSNYGNDDLQQAYRLYTLALADAPEWGAMNRLRDRKNLSNTAKWRLAAAYAAGGKAEAARSLIKGLATEVKPYRELAFSYGSDVRDEAMIAETFVLLKDRSKAMNLVQRISKKLSSDEWESTQTIAYSLLAIGKFVGTDKSSSQFSFSYAIGGESLTNAASSNPIVQINFDPDRNGTKKITVKNTTNSILFARLILEGQPITGDATNNESNMKMTVAYKTLDGKTLNPATLTQGTDFIAEVTLTNPGVMGNYNEMALTQIFPSGWEILNARMDNVSSFSNTSIPQYQDIRDDRVYTYFDLPKSTSQTYRIQLNATYQGKFYLPTAYCEAMYDNSINARKAGQWVEVVSPGSNSTASTN